ncbi:trimeric intracellular cation channel type B [Thalassophryne amazonica]|uniref:trimeric intracellular cation channel type B n=1 Tax=Thalassophryne amazonica TaxID=390379 RepID=UPI001471F101|nr:trimeric intracellular cation channel type B [Thalassophryne amazonica]
MDLFGLVYLDELSHGLANLSMFPYFDMAHYIVSVVALRQQPGALEVSRASPLACWFSSMLYCFGGAILSSIMMAEPPVTPLSRSTSVLHASVIWYLVFYCPWDLVYSCASLLPFKLVLAGMKEVTRTWKVLSGVSQAHGKYKDGLLVMIAVGWARGAGGGLMSNFEQLVRGVWKPETNELLKMSYPTKVTLIGAVLFALQQTQHLPIQKHHLMLMYTVFIVIIKTKMLLTSTTDSPFAAVESAVYRTLFSGHSPYTPLACEVKRASINNGTVNGMTSSAAAKERRDSGATCRCPSPSSANENEARLEDESKTAETKNCKKTD